MPPKRFSTAGESSGAFVRHLLGRLPPGRVLNIGGGHSGAPTDAGDHDIVTVDHVLVASTVAVIADAAQLPFRDGSFDGILMKDVLEHLTEPLVALSEARRACRDGGHLVVVVPRAVPRAVWNDPTHVRGFTRRALRSALDMTGWVAMKDPIRVGSLPGAGRVPVLLAAMPTVMRIPIIGHRLGLNWLVVGRTATAADMAR